MSTNTDTVADRFAAARARIDPTTALAALALAAALGFALAFAQDPLAHEALHDFRHGAGIVCH
jgi:cobalt transporter subunit CbtB